MKRASRLVALLLCVILLFTSVCVGVSAETEYAVGDIVEFGSYPQTQVTDDALIAELNSLELDWVSYGYYSGMGDLSDGQTQPGDFMKYADVTYNGSKYRAVKFTQYRPYNSYSCSADDSCQDDNGYYIDTVYWFKFEPLEWRVLDPAEGFILCESIIDAQAYNNVVYHNSSASSDLRYCYFNSTACTNYASDYETSSIRAWLNDDFYNTAFTSAEKEQIGISALDNSCCSSSYPLLDSAATNDKIFLLSYDDALNTSYGFIGSVTRTAQVTAYAKCQGIYVYSGNGNSDWWLRTPGSYSSSVCRVYYDGDVYDDTIGVEYNIGIRPAIQLDLSALKTEPEHECTYSTEWSFDEKSHWLDCTDPACEETTNYAEHSGGTATVNAKAVCAYCGTAYGDYAKASFAVEPVSDIAYCKTGKREYSVTVVGKPDKIQFIRYTGTTATYVRSQAKITDNGDGTETWVLFASLNKGKYTLAAKYGRVWNKNGVEFEIVFDTPSCRSFTSEKTGNITTFTAVTDPQVAKIQFITQSGGTLTYSLGNSYIGEDGLRYWTVSRKITKPGTIGLRTKYGYTWTTTDFTIQV